jgi:nitrite reductase (NADH) small subunit
MTAPTMTASPVGRPGLDVWVPVCPLDRILPDTGVAALVAGLQVAVFRLADGRIFAIDNHDPCSGANVLARGLVGEDDGRPYVASPVHKQRFDLRSGSCLDEEDVRVAVHRIRVIDGRLEVTVGTGSFARRHGSSPDRT